MRIDNIIVAEQTREKREKEALREYTNRKKFREWKGLDLWGLNERNRQKVLDLINQKEKTIQEITEENNQLKIELNNAQISLKELN